MNRCKDCKWWNPANVEILHNRIAYHSCSRVSLIRGIGRHAPHNQDMSAQNAYCGGEESSGVTYLWTGPEFGCVNWEAKES